MKQLAVFLLFFSLLWHFVGCGGTPEDFDALEENVISALTESDTEEGTDEEPDTKSRYSFKVNCLWYNEYDPPCIQFEGRIRNNTDITYSNMEIYLTAKDANDTYLGVASGPLEPEDLLPGEWATFTASVQDVTCPTETLKLSYRVEKIE